MNSSDEERASKADFQRLLELLQEYTAKLRSYCEARAAERARFLQILVVGSFSGTFVALLTAFVLKSRMFQDNAVNEDVIILMITFPVFFFWLAYGLRVLMRRNYRQTNDAHQLALTVKRLIHTASQYRDHAGNRISDQFEFDLRIAEAETALRAYDELYSRRGIG